MQAALGFTVENELRIGGSVIPVFEKNNEFVQFKLVCYSLDSIDVKHIRPASIPDSKNLLFQVVSDDGFIVCCFLLHALPFLC